MCKAMLLFNLIFNIFFIHFYLVCGSNPRKGLYQNRTKLKPSLLLSFAIQRDGNKQPFFRSTKVDPGLYVKADSMYAIFWTFCTGN